MQDLIEILQKQETIGKKKAITLRGRVKRGGKKIEEVILDDEDVLISENELFSIKSKILDIPFKKEVNLDKLGSILPDMANLIPEDSAKHYKMVPLNKVDNSIEIGMVYPKDLKAQEVLRFLSGRGNFSYDVYLITPSTFNEILDQYGELRKGAGAALGAMNEEEEEIAEEIRKQEEKEDNVEKMA